MKPWPQEIRQTMQSSRQIWTCGLFLSLTLLACTKKTGTDEISARQPLTQEQLIEHGKKMFVANCLSCHGNDPKIDGPVGPAIAGSSQELVQARMMSLQYPPGYTPKRNSHLMVAMPQLQNDIPAIAAYLNSSL